MILKKPHKVGNPEYNLNDEIVEVLVLVTEFLRRRIRDKRDKEIVVRLEKLVGKLREHGEKDSERNGCKVRVGDDAR